MHSEHEIKNRSILSLKSNFRFNYYNSSIVLNRFECFDLKKELLYLKRFCYFCNIDLEYHITGMFINNIYRTGNIVYLSSLWGYYKYLEDNSRLAELDELVFFIKNIVSDNNYSNINTFCQLDCLIRGIGFKTKFKDIDVKKDFRFWIKIDTNYLYVIDNKVYKYISSNLDLKSEIIVKDLEVTYNDNYKYVFNFDDLFKKLGINDIESNMLEVYILN